MTSLEAPLTDATPLEPVAPTVQDTSASVRRAAYLLRRIGTLYATLHHWELAPLLRLNAADVHTLNVLAECGALRPGRYAHLAALSHGGARLSVDRLEKAGLLQIGSTGRGREISINPARQDAVLRIPAGLFLSWLDAQEDASTEDIDTVLDWLERLGDTLLAKARRCDTD